MEILFYFLIGVAIVALGGFLYFENKSLVIKRHLLKFEFLPREFDGFTIVQLSDLHNKWFGKGQRDLVRAVIAVRPDIIVMTGDMVDGILYASDPALELVRGLHDVAPIYYVSGNHEWSRPEYDVLRTQLIELGVHVLDNRAEAIVRDSATVSIAGIDDHERYSEPDPRKAIHRELSAVRATIDERAFKILLVHRPEWLREYMEHHFSLIFAGHAHGGQWDLPLLGPIFAPGQGMFPKLVSGVHKRHSTYMVISRGLGNSGVLAFQRLFNRPEVVSVVLKRTMPK